MRLKTVAAAGILLALLGGLQVQGWAARYQVERIAVQATVEPSGKLAVEETIRFRYQGSFKFAYREFPLKAGEFVDNVRVSEEGQAYRLSSSEEPGTFKVDQGPQRVKVTWYYKARNETRDFRLSYVRAGAVRRHPDTAELYFQFVGDQWDRPIGQVSAVVRFPEAYPNETLRAWAHGPLHGRVELPGDGSVRFEAAPLPARTFWEGRVLFPASAVPEVALASAEPAAERIFAEERAWAEEANRQREARKEAAALRQQKIEQWLPWTVAAALAGLSFWLWLFFLHGRPYAVDRRPPTGQLPSQHSPALVSYLLHRNVGGPALAATLVDLARRGFLTIEQKEREVRRLLGSARKTDYRLELTGKPLSQTADYEKDLVDFVLQSAGDGKGAWLRDFKKATGKSKFRSWFQKWRKQVKQAGSKEGFFEPYSPSVLFLNIACGLAVAGFGLVATILTQSPAGVPAIGAGALQGVLSVALSRRTRSGRELYLAWKAFKPFLVSTAKGREPVSWTAESWGGFLVAAVLLGVNRQFAQLTRKLSDEDSRHFYPWYTGAVHGSDHGLAGLGDGIASMVSAVSSTMSSAAGTGGGASAGGGGGSGGGGGGAG